MRIARNKANGIHIGESTQSQLHVITPPSFKPMKSKAKAPPKPIPPLAVVAVVFSDINSPFANYPSLLQIEKLIKVDEEVALRVFNHRLNESAVAFGAGHVTTELLLVDQFLLVVMHLHGGDVF